MSVRNVTMIGDGIENPANARAMLDVAGMFGQCCRFRDRKDLAAAWTGATAPPLPRLTLVELAAAYQPVIACETLHDAKDVYGCHVPADARAALVVGNERFGLAEDALAVAHLAIRIPLASRSLTSLNVAAASAVALFYLDRGSGPAMVARPDPKRHRPELLLVGHDDHFELGSAVRSAAAFGWDRALVLDPAGVWFGADRARRSEGRAAARRGRNPIRPIPLSTLDQLAFESAVVVSARVQAAGEKRRSGPLGNLAVGSRQVVVVPDETAGPVDPAAFRHLAKRVDVVRLDLPAADQHYRYRAVASIVMAEIARQVGRALTTEPRLPGGRRPRYRSALQVVASDIGEFVDADELEQY